MKTTVFATAAALALLMAPPASAQSSSTRPHDPQASSTTKPSSSTTDRSPGHAVSDGWITMKIHAQFVPEEPLSESDIDVTTRNGVVTLSGTVPSTLGQERAVQIAKATDGVKDVVDRLRVAPEQHRSLTEQTGATGTAREAGRETTGMSTPEHRVSDGWIKSKIYSKYVADDALDAGDVNLAVTNGVVTLRGTVASSAARDRAVSIAKSTDGVKSVQDRLEVSGKDKR